jgi:signal transduction histidine kinase
VRIKVLQKFPLLRLNKIYCALAVGAAVLVAAALVLDLRHPGPPDVQGSRTAVHILVLALLAGTIVCCFFIARQAGIAARRNEELLQEARQRTSEIAALYDTSQYISGQHVLSSLLEIIVGRARTLLATSGCALFLLDQDRNDFEITVEVGVGMPVGTHIPRDAGLAGQVAKTLEPLIVNDYPSWPHRSKVLEQLPIGATVCVPMIRRGELIGVLGVHESGNTQRKFTEAEARLLYLFADNAASAVYNARLLDALQNSKERFRIAAECASDIVYDWNLTADSVEYFGAGFKRAQASMAVMPATREAFWHIVHPEDRERVREALDDHFKNGNPFSVEYRIRDENGAFIVISDRGIAIRNSQGEAVRLIGAVSNITARKHAEQMKSDFVSFVTHQLRTPLSGVKWMLELAVDSMGNPENTEDALSYIRDAQMSTARLIGLVNDLLDISRLERGKLEITRETVRFQDLTREVLDEMRPMAFEKAQSVSVDAAETVPAIEADRQLLRQVLINLTSNAVKYTPSGGRIKIRIHNDDSFVYWEIEDNGIGIPKADQRKLFEKFFRAGNVAVVETEGTGLGLCLVRLIVERLGGTVGCESREGSGSTFKFSIPIAVREV